MSVKQKLFSLGTNVAAFGFGGLITMTVIGYSTGKVEYFYGPPDRVLHLYPLPVRIIKFPSPTNTNTE